MGIKDYIESIIKSQKLDALYEAAGPDAWDDPMVTVREIATAMQNGDREALWEAMSGPFFHYMYEHAAHYGIALDEDEGGDEPDAAHASRLIDRDNAAEINAETARSIRAWRGEL